MFKTPIQYLSNTKQLTNDCVNDLQLDIVYNTVLGCESSSEIRKSWLNDYTTNVQFLKDTQEILSDNKDQGHSNNLLDIVKKKINQMKENPSFCEKYEYITVEYFKNFNRNESILQAISMYTLSSPIFSLIMPVLMLFVPFFILRFLNKPISMSNYLEQLKTIFSLMPIGRIFQMGDVSWDQRGMIMFSVILYFVQMYQNTLTCYKFYKHSHEMTADIHQFGEYCYQTANSMEEFVNSADSLTTYTPFCQSLTEHIPAFKKLGDKFTSLNKATFRDMGLRMKIFYDMYCDEDHESLFNFSYSYYEYLDNIMRLRENKELIRCHFTKTKFAFIKSYYGLLETKNPIKNSYSLKKNGILSGPNASGKTTLLKSTMINTILCQQIGKGFFAKSIIVPQDFFHCYINIPDTCGRDSLFQAEARRCKDIINFIHKYPNAKHFCVFDELFSGTNPYEAIGSASGYLEYLHKYKNVTYLLTTHYLDLCKRFKESDAVENYTLEKPYNLRKGISSVKGGIKVLEQLEFPEEIIDTAKKMVS